MPEQYFVQSRTEDGWETIPDGYDTRELALRVAHYEARNNPVRVIDEAGAVYHEIVFTEENSIDLRGNPLKEIRESYGIAADTWARLCHEWLARHEGYAYTPAVHLTIYCNPPPALFSAHHFAGVGKMVEGDDDEELPS